MIERIDAQDPLVKDILATVRSGKLGKEALRTVRVAIDNQLGNMMTIELDPSMPRRQKDNLLDAIASVVYGEYFNQYDLSLYGVLEGK